jgi:DNA-binding response OmpR family regulator
MSRIMLVEDDPTMLDLLSTLLKLEGFEVVFFDEGIGILDSIKERRPDLIVMDVHLRLGGGKEISGFDLLEKIRTDAVLKRTKVIMSSGMDLRFESKESRADDFILKPFMPEELIGKIKKLVE